MILENANVLIINDLVNQFYWSRNAGPYRIATEVRKHGYTCQVIDCFTALSDEENFKIFERAVGDKTLIVGLSSTFFFNVDNPGQIKNANRYADKDFAGYTTNYPFSVERMEKYFQKIKTINPNVKIVLGGYKASLYDAPGVDVLMTGLADVAIIEYLKYLENKNPFFQFTKLDNGQISVDGDASHSKFNFQSSEIIYEKHDNILPEEVLSIEVSRGCIFRCNFCSYALNGKKNNDYIKDANVVKEELLRNYYEYGVTKYFYSDDTHNDNIDKLKALADVVQKLPFELQYSAYIRLDLLRAHPEQYQLLKDGGLKGAFFGIESLHWPSLKSIGKGLHPDKVIEELYNFESKMPHVGTEGSFIVGLPYETKETVTEWVEKIGDKSFPLDTFYLETLIINRNPKKLYPSEFDKSTKNYYTFLNDHDDHWHNGHFDKDWAWAFVVDAYKKYRTKDRRRLGGWLTLMLSNYKIKKDYVKTPLSEIKINWQLEKDKIREEYKTLLFREQ